MVVSPAARFEQGRHAVIARILEKIEVAQPAAAPPFVHHPAYFLRDSLWIVYRDARGRPRHTVMSPPIAYGFRIAIYRRDISYSVSL